MYCKQITLILFICLIIALCLILFKWLYDIFTNKNNKIYEYFNKRDIKIKIYKKDEILDPDENPINEEYDPDNAPDIFDTD